MYLHKSEAQKRKEKENVIRNNERKGLQTLFQFNIKKSQDDAKTYPDTNFIEGEGTTRWQS